MCGILEKFDTTEEFTALHWLVKCRTVVYINLNCAILEIHVSRFRVVDRFAACMRRWICEGEAGISQSYRRPSRHQDHGQEISRWRLAACSYRDRRAEAVVTPAHMQVISDLRDRTQVLHGPRGAVPPLTPVPSTCTPMPASPNPSSSHLITDWLALP